MCAPADGEEERPERALDHDGLHLLDASKRHAHETRARRRSEQRARRRGEGRARPDGGAHVAVGLFVARGSVRAAE